MRASKKPGVDVTVEVRDRQASRDTMDLTEKVSRLTDFALINN
jgi:hypothetical protein